MYMCFEEDDRRLAFPELSLIAIDGNGFTLNATGPGKGGNDRIFLKLSSHQGCVQNFAQALAWLKKKPKVAPTAEFTNSAGVDLMGTAPKARQAAQAAAPKLPEAPSF